jgi:hypothetical protein
MKMRSFLYGLVAALALTFAVPMVGGSSIAQAEETAKVSKKKKKRTKKTRAKKKSKRTKRTKKAKKKKVAE